MNQNEPATDHGIVTLVWDNDLIIGIAPVIDIFETTRSRAFKREFCTIDFGPIDSDSWIILEWLSEKN